MDEETNVIQNEIEETYPIKDLIENCEALTGYRKEVAVGATFNCGKEEMTKKNLKEELKIS